MLAFNKAGNPLQVATATADEANVMQTAVVVHLEKNLSGTSAFGRISKHGIYLPFLVFFAAVKRGVS